MTIFELFGSTTTSGPAASVDRLEDFSRAGIHGLPAKHDTNTEAFEYLLEAWSGGDGHNIRLRHGDGGGRIERSGKVLGLLKVHVIDADAIHVPQVHRVVEDVAGSLGVNVHTNEIPIPPR